MRTKCFAAVLIVIMLLSGCMVTEKSEDESLKEYRKYFGESAIKLQKSLEYEKEGKEFLDTRDFDKAIENFEKRKNLLIEAKSLIQKAYDSVDDEELKEYAYYGTKKLEYSILFEESRIKGIEYLKEGNINASKQMLREAQEYLEKDREWYEKSKVLLQKLREEGKL